MTEVINVRNAPSGWQDNPKYVYIGRKNARYNLPQSKWRNKFVLNKDGTREEVVEKYRQYILKSNLVNDLHELKDKILVCWCKPKKCHGDVLIELLEENNG